MAKATKTHDLVISVGEYEVNGEKKRRLKNIGNVFTREDGSKFLAIDSTVIAMETQYVANKERNDKVMVNIYEIKERSAGGGNGGAAKPAASGGGGATNAAGGGGNTDEFSDDIPF